MIVMKFGGTSVGSGERIANVARITAQTTERTGTPPVVVLSAMSGVTDSLLRAARTAASGDGISFRTIRQELQAKHEQAIATCVTDPEHARGLRAEVSTLLNWLENICQSVQTLGELTPRGLDILSGLGERLCVRIAAAAMLSQGLKAQTVEATELIVTDSNFGNASPLFEETTARVRARLLPLIQAGIVPVVTGFIGATADGVPTTLGRGGSDYSATIIGRCLPADEVWVWTDVDGVMTADPRIVPEARTLPSISYAEMAELAFFGAKVLHPKTMQPVVQANIPLRVLNSSRPDHPGTLVGNEITELPAIKGITAIRDLSVVSVEGLGMLGVPGIAGRVFSAVARSGASILMITQSSSEQTITFVLRSVDTPAVVQAIDKEFELELMRGDIDQVHAQSNVAIIAVVDAGMPGKPGIAARVFSALADKGINILSIAQGSSAFNLSLVVNQADVDEGVRAIHKQFNLDQV
ncbi:MAG: aspartate kinase [Chloroflexi bacterium]|jgi:aspartokinase/homoserine dehydrogenase 1|nr:aspartate kinase [Chloroflexota bacterium]